MSGESTAIEWAMTDLAARLDVPQSDLVLVQSKAMQWPDGSLGCPEEGQLYTQAIVDGFQILISYGERIYDYRSDDGGHVRFCPSKEKDGGRAFVPPPRDS